MITYNHEAYLAEALEGVLRQQGHFQLEVTLGVDLSADRTLAIAREYERQFPTTLRILEHRQRAGMMGNFIATFAACRDADYIAVLEGDDRWISPDKLHTQLQFMRDNPGCAVCYHDVRIREEGTPARLYSARRPRTRARWGFEDFIFAPHWVHTCSVLYRNHFRGQLPGWMADLKVGDWPTHVLHASRGWVGRIAREMAEYRVHGGGVWSGAPATHKEKAFLDVYRELDRHFEGRHHAAFGALAFARLLNIACITTDQAERSWALAEASKYSDDPDRAKWPLRTKVKRLVGYRPLRMWRLLAYGDPRGWFQ